MDDRFYSPSNQFRRELRFLWQSRPAWSMVSGSLFVLLAFYALHAPGASQVYNVLIPYWVASVHIAVLAVAQMRSERNRSSGSWFSTFPRDRIAMFDARIAFFVTQALFLELIIGMGIHYTLGSGGITPIYRLFPEMLALPLCAALGAICIQFRTATSGKKTILSILFLAIVTIGMSALNSSSAATSENNYLPPRGITIWWSFAATLALLTLLSALTWHARKSWRHSDWMRP